MISIYKGRRDDMRDGRQLAVEIIFSVTDNTLIAELFGELDHHAAEGAREKIDEALDNYRVDNLVFDFAKISFMDSSGIGFIIGRYKTVSALGGKLSIASPSKEADRILSISGIYRIINSYKTVEDAVLGINQEVHN